MPKSQPILRRTVNIGSKGSQSKAKSQTSQPRVMPGRVQEDKLVTTASTVAQNIKESIELGPESEEELPLNSKLKEIPFKINGNIVPCLIDSGCSSMLIDVSTVELVGASRAVRQLNLPRILNTAQSGKEDDGDRCGKVRTKL